MKRLLFPSLALAMCLSACGNPPPEKAILGEWVQDTPTSTTQGNLESVTSNTVLDFEKDGDVSLRRQLDLAGPSLPANGVSLDVALSGFWRLENGHLVQTLESASITPRQASDIATDISEQLQAHATTGPETHKTIIVLDRSQLILQDVETDVTDVYRRK